MRQYRYGQQTLEDEMATAERLNIPNSCFEWVPLSKILIYSPVDNPISIGKTHTRGAPILTKNKYGEYAVYDGRNRVISAYIDSDILHHTKIPCVVWYKPNDPHYRGYYVWDAVKLSAVNPRRGIVGRVLGFFGLFKRFYHYDYFTLSPKNQKRLTRKTVLLLEDTEDHLDALYQDFTARICSFLALLKKEHYSSSGYFRGIKKKFARYQAILEKLVGEEKQEESLLRKLSAAIDSELTQPFLKDNPEVKEIKKILQGEGETKGLINIFQSQLNVIKSGKLPPNFNQFEAELIQELEYAQKILTTKRERFWKTIYQLVRDYT